MECTSKYYYEKKIAQQENQTSGACNVTPSSSQGSSEKGDLEGIAYLDIDKPDHTKAYTNIIHEEGLEAMRSWMIENNISQQRAQFIKILGTLVLKNNYFEFNGEIYLQQQGTAMGTRMASNYAIIFMHKIETELLNKSETKSIQEVYQ